MRVIVPRKPGYTCIGLVLTCIVMAAPVSAKRTQAQLTATFKDRDAPAAREVETVRTCAVRFTEIVDARRSPEIVGVVAQRGVLAPKDARAWLHAILNGLAARGVRPVFGTDTIAESGTPAASFTLQTAWIASTASTYSANVVVHLKASDVTGRSLDQTYRGRVSRTAYWSGGVDTLQSAMDGAFADALDAMARDLKPFCGS